MHALDVTEVLEQLHGRDASRALPHAGDESGRHAVIGFTQQVEDRIGGQSGCGNRLAAGSNGLPKGVVDHIAGGDPGDIEISLGQRGTQVCCLLDRESIGEVTAGAVIGTAHGMHGYQTGIQAAFNQRFLVAIGPDEDSGGFGHAASVPMDFRRDSGSPPW